MGGLRRKFMGNQMITTEFSSRAVISEKQEQNIIHWTTLFRRNWHIYAEFILGIQLRPFQAVMLWLMGISDIFFAICSNFIAWVNGKYRYLDLKSGKIEGSRMGNIEVSIGLTSCATVTSRD